MIRIPELVAIVQADMADAEVNVLDKTGMGDHFIVHVSSERFTGMNLMDRHRLVQGILEPAMKDGRIHALEIKTAVPGA
jgi:stress-induced morphogen